MGQSEFFTVDQVLKELQIDRERLTQLIREGEITAYPSEAGKFKFLKSDVLDYKARIMGQDTISVHENDVELLDQIASESEVIPPEPDTIIEDKDLQPLLSMGSDDEIATMVADHEAQAGEEVNPMLELGGTPDEVESLAQEEHAAQVGDEKDFGDEEHLRAPDNFDELPKGKAKDDGTPEDQMLDISDEQLGEQYLAEMQQEIKDENETGELQFEHNEGDQFMETGEVLSESIQHPVRKLPADKEAEDLALYQSESRGPVEVEPIKHETHIQDEVDFNEEQPSPEEGVGVAEAELGEELTVESGSKTKFLIGIAVLLAICLGSGFVLFDPLKLGFTAKPVDMYAVALEKAEIQYDAFGQIQAVQFNLISPNAGTIVNLQPVNQTIAAQQALAMLRQEVPEYQAAQAAKAAAAASLQKTKAPIEALDKFRRTTANRQFLTDLQKAGTDRKKLADVAKKYVRQYAEYNRLAVAATAATKAKTEAAKKLQEADDQLAKFPNPYQEVPVVAMDGGKIVEWKVQENAQVEQASVLAVLEAANTLELKLMIPSTQAPVWEQGQEIILVHQGQPIKLNIKQIQATDTQYQVMGTLATLNVDEKVQFSYAKSEDMLIIPSESVYTEAGASYVFAIQENKLVKQSIQTKPIWNDSTKLAVISGLKVGDQIVKTQDLQLKEGDKVKIKQ